MKSWDKCKIDGCNRWIQRKGYCYNHLKEYLPDIVKKIDSDYANWFQRRYHGDEEYKANYYDRQHRRYETYREKRLAEKKEYHKKTYPITKEKVLMHYTNGIMRCQCHKCDVTNPHFLTIDHVNGDGAAHKKQIKNRRLYQWLIANNFPDGFTVLCYNCNCSKGANNVCGHFR